MDRLTKEQRHRNMAAIHGRDTKPEMIVRKFLFSRGFLSAKSSTPSRSSRFGASQIPDGHFCERLLLAWS